MNITSQTVSDSKKYPRRDYKPKKWYVAEIVKKTHTVFIYYQM